MLVKTLTAAILGIDAIAVTVEINFSRGIKFSLVGLPDNAIRESHERIISALRENDMDIPRKQIIINMSPANLKKEGTSYDLPLTVGLMAAGKYIPQSSLKNTMFAGELSLDGTLQPIRGALSIAILCRDLKIKRLILPKQNAREAGVVNDIQVIGIKNIKQLREYLNNNIEIENTHIDEKDLFNNKDIEDLPDFSDVKGQEEVKRAIEVACSGSHNILLISPPGTGKTMMAKCIPGILPPISLLESLETTKIHSVAGKTLKNESIITKRPFIAPHHSISSVALVGGGNKPKPGEISLAHNGVLFLDELPEFQRNVLEVLRQPLEDGTIRISRSNYDVIYPANFMLVASMNPCPCGYYNHPTKECVCTEGQIKRYMNKISGPLLDRIEYQ